VYEEVLIMERLSIVITGRLGSDPRLDTTNSGTPKAIMSVAVEPRNGPDGPTRWFTVTAYRHLATHVAESLRKGDNVIVKADDIQAWTWTDERTKETRAGVGLIAYDIAASMRFAILTTGSAARRAAQANAEASGEIAADAAEHANLSVLDGVTA
jgi:single-strand DNA-binding protein